MVKRKGVYNFETSKIDKEFAKDMKELARFRYVNKLSKKLPSMPKMTNLWRRTDGYKQSYFELKTKSEKEND